MKENIEKLRKLLEDCKDEEMKSSIKKRIKTLEERQTVNK